MRDYRNNPPRRTDDSSAHPWGPLARYYRETLAYALGMGYAFVSSYDRAHALNAATVREITNA